MIHFLNMVSRGCERSGLMWYMKELAEFGGERVEYMKQFLNILTRGCERAILMWSVKELAECGVGKSHQVAVIRAIV